MIDAVRISFYRFGNCRPKGSRNTFRLCDEHGSASSGTITSREQLL